jgi:peroxiredoxin
VLYKIYEEIDTDTNLSGNRNMRTQFHLFRYILCVCIGLILIFTLSCSEAKQPETIRNSTKKMAPDFTLKNLSGKTFRLSEQKGKPVLLIFITTWCPSCRSEIPHYKNIYETYGKRGLEVAMIDIQESKGKVSSFAAKHGIPFTIVLDENADVSGAFGIVGVPSMFLISKEGSILTRQYTAIDAILETIFGNK